MKYLDRVLQKWRISKAMRHLPSEVSLIDVGAHQGELFDALGFHLRTGFGIEPLLHSTIVGSAYTIHPGRFPKVRPNETGWDAITMLAVMEHIPREDHDGLVDACYNLLKSGGRVVLTIPSHFVDRLLSALKFLKLVDGMATEEHFGFQPTEVLSVFAAPRFRILHHSRFQLGLNHLYVFGREPINIDSDALVSDGPAGPSQY